jgi:hypothetical protein
MPAAGAGWLRGWETIFDPMRKLSPGWLYPETGLPVMLSQGCAAPFESSGTVCPPGGTYDVEMIHPETGQR